jgi:hypothetical protein
VPHTHPLDALDARILHAQTRRANVPRFSDVYWQADDEIAWMRAARDEIARTGSVHPEVEAMLHVAPPALPVVREREPIAFPIEPLAIQDVAPEPARIEHEVAVGAA